MPILSEHAVFIFVAEIGVILLLARIFGEVAVRLGQPIIVGELVAGIVLGPAIFGQFFPEIRDFLFPQNDLHPYLLQGLSWLSVIFLLLITGVEIDFRVALSQGRQSLIISIVGLVVSLAGVFIASRFLPEYLYPPGINPLHVQLMVSISLAVVAIPVIAKILFDLKILRSQVGVNILTSGVLSDVWGWTIIAVVISLVGEGAITTTTVLKPLITMVLYLYLTLRYGQRIVDKCFDLLGYKTLDTTTALSFMFSLALINGAIAHTLGIHVIFGAFVAGVMAGESEKITPYVRQWTQDFIFGVFAPIFFVLIGMQLNFSNLDVLIPMIILLIVSSVCRIGGGFLGGIVGGLGQKNALAVACGLNTQGTMGIIVALIAYEMHIFTEDMFSMIVLICILTSLLVGPLLKWAMKGVQRPMAKFFDREHVFLNVEGSTKKDVIKNMVDLMVGRKIVTNPTLTRRAIWDREQTLSTAIGEGVAVPHARLRDLKTPVLCFFRLKDGVDFGSPDNKPVQLLFLELTDKNDDGMQLNLIAQVSRFISSEKNRKRLLDCKKEDEVHSILSIDEKA